MFRAYWADSRQSQLKVETCLPRSETQFSGMYAVVACSEVWLVSSSLWKYVITSTNHRASLPDSFCTDQWEKELICVRPIREQRSSRQRYTEHWETAQSWLDQSELSICDVKKCQVMIMHRRLEQNLSSREESTQGDTIRECSMRN